MQSTHRAVADFLEVGGVGGGGLLQLGLDYPLLRLRRIE